MDFEEFATREYPRLVGALTLFCGDPWTAEELAQETLLRAGVRWARVGAMRAPGAWAHRVALNLATSGFRRRQAERRAYRRTATRPHADASGPAGAADAVAIRQAVSSLPPSQRAAIIHRYFLDRSVAETAALMDMTDASVRSATHRGLVALRRRFGVDVPSRTETHDV